MHGLRLAERPTSGDGEQMTMKIQPTTSEPLPACAGYAPEYPPKISVFASFPGEEYFQRRHERYATRKEAAAGIRDARAKGGFDINVLDPWSKKREAHNTEVRQAPAGALSGPTG